MASEPFNYDAADTPDEVVRGIAAEVSDSALKPLTDVEIAEREEWRRDYLARQEQERLAAEQHTLAQEQEREAAAQREKAEWLAEHRQKEAIRQHERAVEIDRQVTQRSLSDLRMAAARADSFQHDVRTAHAQSVRQQQMTSLFAELEKAINESALTSPSPNFATLYRQNQRSGLYYFESEDSEE
jgi:hypothetical protein